LAIQRRLHCNALQDIVEGRLYGIRLGLFSTSSDEHPLLIQDFSAILVLFGRSFKTLVGDDTFRRANRIVIGKADWSAWPRNLETWNAGFSQQEYCAWRVFPVRLTWMPDEAGLLSYHCFPVDGWRWAALVSIGTRVIRAAAPETQRFPSSSRLGVQTGSQLPAHITAALDSTAGWIAESPLYR
jgi:hypothetical protein